MRLPERHKERMQRLAALGFEPYDDNPAFVGMFVKAPWGGLPYCISDITDEDIARWEGGEQDQPVYDHGEW